QFCMTSIGGQFLASERLGSNVVVRVRW
ncbi:hypothetical protein GCK32_017785, partial [Trichostrongylus colubriformis]